MTTTPAATATTSTAEATATKQRAKSTAMANKIPVCHLTIQFILIEKSA